MDRTNVTDSGYTYNGQNYANQTKVDGNGNNYTVAIPTSINSSSLGSNTPVIPITQPNYNTSGQATQAAQAAAYTNSSAVTAEQQAKIAEDNARAALTSQNSDLAKLQAAAGGKGQDTLNAYNATDSSGNTVNTLAGRLRNLSAQSTALGYQGQIIPSQIQNSAAGTGATDRGVAPLQSQQVRDNLIQQATIAMQSAIAKADYDTAKSYADQLVTAKYDQQLADIEAAKTNIENAKFTFTSAEKKLADATTARLNKEKQDYEKKIADEKAISDIGMTLRKYGVSDAVVKDVLASGSVNDALLKAGNNLRDPKADLEIKQIKADIALKEAQARKADREAVLTKEPTAAEKKEAAASVASAKASRQAAQDKIEGVDAILNLGTGIASRVGPNVLSRGIVGPTIGGAAAGAGLGPIGIVGGAIAGGATGIGSALSGSGQQLSGAVHQLTSGLTLQTLIDAKANGATFGALSDGERSMIASAATKLNDWEIKDDKGNPTGYWNIDEKSFKNELKTIQDLSRKALLKSQGTLIAPDESTQLDSLFPQAQPTANQYFN